MTHSAGQMQHPYPAQLSIAYPESSNRLTVLFRLILALPIIVIAGLVGGGFSSGDANADGWIAPLAAGGALWLAPMLMILFRRKYPRWWFDWNLGLSRFMARVTAYLLLLRDDYPATDDLQAVTLEIAYPDVERHLNRFLALVKWLLALPHYVVLSFLAVATVIVTVIAWFAVLLVGRYPQGLFRFVEGTLRWGVRVEAYAFMFATDEYPPFRLSP